MRRRVRDLPPLPHADMPPELAHGPEIGRWGGGFTGMDGSIRAWRAWRTAIAAWAVHTGVPVEDARSRARTKHPWDRDYLLRAGRADLAAYYDGRGPWPPHPPNTWIGAVY